MKWNKKVKNLIFPLFLITVCLIIAFGFMPENTDGKLTVVFINTGNSDSIFIKMPDGKTALIDGGLEDSLREIHNVLYNYNVKTLDYLINTHQHDDHLGSFPKLLKVYSAKNFYMPKSNIGNEHFDVTKEMLKKNNIPINIIKRGDIICDGEVKIEVLAPLEDMESANENNYSAVLLLTFGEKTFLFTGDAERAIINSLVVDYKLSHCDVLKSGHHGSKNANPFYALEIISPDFAVITSEAEDNENTKYIKKVFTDLKTEYYFTGEHGNITMISDGKNIEIKTGRKIKNEDR